MRYLLILPLALILSACGTTSKVNHVMDRPEQYCHTKQQIVLDANGQQTVESKTVVECNDDLEERYFTTINGISSHCGKVAVWPTINGRPTKRFAYACQMLDGTYRYVTDPY